MAIDFSDYKAAQLPLSYFEEISAIPHPSSHTERLTDYLVNFAQAHGLEYRRDSYGNVLIRKDATPGMEDRDAICFQGHIDMVAEADAACGIDMTKEPITLYRDGDFLRAKGTTLGGDDGVAVAYALAILASKDLPHPPFEALFTADEEIGLLGATALEVGELRAKYLITIDSDEEGVFTVGCAGGCRTDIKRSLTYESTDAIGLTVSVTGGKGGHSGVQINQGRANAIKLLGELLAKVCESLPVRIGCIRGGGADNAIPAECTAWIEADKARFSALAEEIFACLKAPYAETDGDLALVIGEGEPLARVLCEQDQKILLSTLTDAPSGVVKMSEDIPGLPETSVNLGRIKVEDGMHLVLSVRSSKESEKLALCKRLVELAESAGAEYSERGNYPAWEYAGPSRLSEVCESVYRKLYQKEPTTLIIHAGLECGILTSKYPQLRCLSLGPDNFDIHTPRERLSLSSFTRVWEFLLEVLKTI